MRVADLAVLVLQQIGAVAVQNAGFAAVERGGVHPGLDAVPGGLDTDHRDRGLVEKWMEKAHRVGAAADAGNERIGEAVFRLQHLLAGLAPDDRLEIAHHCRVGVGPRDGADHVKRVVDMRHQSRNASFIASFNVAVPECTGTTSAPKSFMRNTLGFCRSMSVWPI